MSSDLGELDFDIEIDLDFLDLFDLDFDFPINDGGMQEYVEDQENFEAFGDW